MLDSGIESALKGVIQSVLSENGGGEWKIRRLIAAGDLCEEEAVLVRMNVNLAKVSRKLDSVIAKLGG